MSVKQVEVRSPGGDVKVHVAIMPETTARDVLREAGFAGRYFLVPASADRFFTPGELVDPLVSQGDVLHAIPEATVGGGSLVGLVLVVALGVLTGVMVSVATEQAKKPSGEARPGGGAGVSPLPGWRMEGEWHCGTYSAGELALHGRIWFRGKWEHCFQAFLPPGLVRACGVHRTCFIPKSEPQPDGSMWYEVHFSKRPESLLAGVCAIQKMLGKAAGKMAGAAA